MISRIYQVFAVFLPLFLTAKVQAELQDTAAKTHQIDELIEQGLRDNKLQPNSPIGDEQFVRRIYLAAVGRIPTAVEAREFLNDRATNKRDVLIDKLLQSEGYVSHFYNYWADILRINNKLGRSGKANEYAYKHWVKNSLRDNKPYDQMVRELVASEGNTWENGATGYYQRDRGMPLDNMANTVRIFLGTRLECAQCHDHPFDKWSQTDFFHMASFTYGVKSGYAGGENRRMYSKNSKDNGGAKAKREYLAKLQTMGEEITGIKGFHVSASDSQIKKLFSSDNRKFVQKRSGLTEEEYRELNAKVLAAVKKMPKPKRPVSSTRKLISDIYKPLQYAAVDVNDRDAKLPHDYQYDDAKPHDLMPPGTMFGGEITAKDLEEGYLPAYAKWMTSKDNPRFAQVIANRLWKQVFGVGQIEPVDQITDYTKAANPELVKLLEQSMKDLDFDMKSFLAMLFKTEAWQRQPYAGEIAPAKPFHFPGPKLQRMSAEQIWDSIVTLVTPDADNYQPGKAKELAAIEREEELYDALESKSPEEFRTMVDGLAATVKVAYARQTEIRSEFLKAKQDEDEALARKLSTELKAISKETNRAISKAAYGGGEAANMMMMDAGKKRTKTKTTKKLRLEIPKGLSKQEAREWAKKQKATMAQYNNLANTMMRASELPTPAPRGHFLREFGQSDRELIQNANDGASVPQALNLMNSRISELLIHPQSVLGQSLAKCDSPKKEISTIYRHMLTREPSKAESNRLLQIYENDTKTARANTVWALLNTQQFIFAE